MSHHKRYSSGRRTRASHTQAWQQVASTINDILSDNTSSPKEYFESKAINLHNLGLDEFVGASRRGINMQGYINLQDFFLDIAYGIIDTTNIWCIEVANHMKQTHPWHNQTQQAEEGLGAAVAGMDGDSLQVYVYHSVPYGHFLEGWMDNARSAPFRYRYAGLLEVIRPTIEDDGYGQMLLERIAGVLKR